MKPETRLSAIFLFCGLFFLPSVSSANEPFIGQLMIFGGNFCPRGWANADGQLLPINQNQALFSIFGTYYGGDGRTTFGLPDLRGRVPIHVGQGPGLTDRRQGSKGGEESHALNKAEMPNHHHPLYGSIDRATESTAQGNLLASPKRGPIYAQPSKSRPVPLNNRSIGPQGSSRKHNVMQPFQTLRYCVALTGVYPSRN